MIINPFLLKDFYKVGHIDQYPEGTTLIFNNFTPRKSLLPGINHSVFFGMNIFIKEFLERTSRYFRLPPGDYKEIDHDNYDYVIKNTLGITKTHKHIENLRTYIRVHRKLPLTIFALPEKSIVPCGVPALVMFNTEPEFYWLPNMLETILSCMLWGPCTSATIAREYRLVLDKYAEETSDNPGFVDYQAHDFSFRGMNGLDAAIYSGMAHLQYFKGTDTIPAMIGNLLIYNKKLEICSVPATEHSVMSAGGKETEFETFERLITKVYPNGIVSIVSDTWDLWNVIDNILPKLKDKIMDRNGKIVIRPDSGDPVRIICGNSRSHPCSSSAKGLIERLWDIFGGTINSKGYKELDPHIGAIYGDSITLDRCREICEKLKQKGFSSTNIVFGIGSYTYQYNTRDTLGWAMKATYCEINGIGYPITKDPKTDNGTKKSHSGLLKVIKDDKEQLKVLQNVTWDEFHQPDNELKKVY